MTSLVGSHTRYTARNLLGLVGAAVTPLFTRHFHYTEVARTKNGFSSTVEAKTLLDMKPYEFVKHMKKNNLKRCFVVFDKASDSVLASNEIFSDLKTFCEKDEIDYKDHEGFFLEIGRRSGALLGAFVWRTNRGQAVCLSSKKNYLSLTFKAFFFQTLKGLSHYAPFKRG